MPFIKELENDFMRFEDHGDVLYIWYKEGVFTLEMARTMVAERLKFTDNLDVKVLIFQDGVKGVKKEARAYFSSEEGRKGVSAAAILARNAFERHLANFFIGITVRRLRIPTKLFSHEKEALIWLRSL